MRRCSSVVERGTRMSKHLAMLRSRVRSSVTAILPFEASSRSSCSPPTSVDASAPLAAAVSLVCGSLLACVRPSHLWDPSARARTWSCRRRRHAIAGLPARERSRVRTVTHAVCVATCVAHPARSLGVPRGDAPPARGGASGGSRDAGPGRHAAAPRRAEHEASRLRRVCREEATLTA